MEVGLRQPGDAPATSIRDVEGDGNEVRPHAQNFVVVLSGRAINEEDDENGGENQVEEVAGDTRRGWASKRAGWE